MVPAGPDPQLFPLPKVGFEQWQSLLVVTGASLGGHPRPREGQQCCLLLESSAGKTGHDLRLRKDSFNSLRFCEFVVYG